MTPPPANSLVEKVESKPGDRWATVTVRDSDGRTREIRVRRGSIFAKRPKAEPAK